MTSTGWFDWPRKLIGFSPGVICKKLQIDLDYVARYPVDGRTDNGTKSSHKVAETTVFTYLIKGN